MGLPGRQTVKKTPSSGQLGSVKRILSFRPKLLGLTQYAVRVRACVRVYVRVRVCVLNI